MTADTLSGPAPAKLNLFLHVTGRRPDGFHTLQTVFQFIDLCDTVRVDLRTDGEVRRVAGLTGIDPASDLTVRAARALQAAAESGLGVDIHVTKVIPAAGGLGGGSSDAATTLNLLNRLWGLDWATVRLARLGLALGADVPVFLAGRAAWAEGIGEDLTPIEPPEPWYLVVDPGCTVVTAELYQAPDLTRDTPGMTIPDFVSGGGHNDFEPVVRKRYPEVGEALDWLSAYGVAKLTGTGGCVFAAFADEAGAQAVREALPRRWHGIVARGLNRSPLIGA